MPPIRILYATMTGNSRDAAEILRGRLARALPPGPSVGSMGDCDPRGLAGGDVVLFLASTFGHGDPPEPAAAFWESLRTAANLDLRGVRFAVAAFGDSAYPRFCQFGRDLDGRLAALGAGRLLPLATCDVDWEDPFDAWVDAVVREAAASPPAADPRGA